MSKVIGIDLGTTNCCVAVLEGFSPKVIANRVGYKTTPSIVAVTESGKRVVGQMAARQAITNPKHTVYASKRLLGRSWDSPQVRHAVEHTAYELTQEANGGVRITLRGDTYSVPEIAAMLLQEMRVVAEEHIQETVERAVVTVPAYFNDAQRQAVRDAGRIAGLDVLRILNEPTAAALAYGFNKGEDQTIAVYDLGGGTFDISIVRLTKDGTFSVIATTGDSYLGGEDFDERVMDWLIKGFQQQNDIDLRESPIALQRLKQAAQKAKCELSSVEETSVELPFIISEGPSGPLNMDYTISRAQLEQLTGDLVTRTLGICETAMKQAKLKTGSIDEVILVGGMTRMPAVQWAVAQFFDKEPCKGVHPDEVVALGAAIQGAALTEKIEGLLLEDVTAHSLGIMTAGAQFDVIIPGNQKVPAEAFEEFTTSEDNQDEVKIIVLQGESEAATDNEPLGQLTLAGIRKAPAGSVDIEVAFRINADGIFSVTAKDLETGEATQADITAQSGLSEEDIQRMMGASASFLAERRSEEKGERVKQDAETMLADLEKLVATAEAKSGATPAESEAIERAKKAINKGRGGLADGNVNVISSQLTAMEAVRGMLQRFVQ